MGTTQMSSLDPTAPVALSESMPCGSEAVATKVHSRAGQLAECLRVETEGTCAREAAVGIRGAVIDLTARITAFPHFSQNRAPPPKCRPQFVLIDSSCPSSNAPIGNTYALTPKILVLVYTCHVKILELSYVFSGNAANSPMLRQALFR